MRSDGQIIVLTYFKNEKVIGFTRLVTDGFFEAVATIPDPVDTYHDQIWVAVRRIIDDVPKRYIEILDDNLTFGPLLSRNQFWKMAQTDSCVFYQGAPVTTLAVAHLEGKLVDVVGDGAYRGQKRVRGGIVTFDEEYSEIEVGLHYDSTVTTMRPAVQGSIIEGLPRSWDKLFIRLGGSWGGQIRSAPDGDFEPLQYPDTVQLFNGDIDVSGVGWGLDGRVTVKQDQPLPFTLLAIFGTLSVGDHD